MQIKKEIKKDAYGVRISAEEDGKEVGVVYLYIIYNSVHKEPCGFLEYVIIDDAYQGKGIGTELVQEVIKEAKERGCYKLIACSRAGKDKIHKWYEKLGFKNYGLEFRMDFK